jgi:hypothetical protein
MNRTRSPLRDRELVELLSEEPELLAIADALVATQSRGPTVPRVKAARLHRGWAYLATATAVAAAALALLVAAPWRGSGSFVGRALAAVGGGPVLHVVTEQQQSSAGGWYQPVSLATGKPLPVTVRQELWFDQSRDLKKTITIVNGVVADQLLETPAGGFTSAGPVYTCAWIAAHPVAATKARVSCNANMQNGAKPRHIPEQRPTLDLALAGFIDQYRAALASGRATRIGTGQVDGHQVIWLRITVAGQDPAVYPRTEEVAIDASSYAPVLVRTRGAQPVEFKVREIGTQSYDGALFTRPVRTYPPTGGETEGTSQIDVAQVPALLGGKALWLGQSWNGYRLVGAERQDLTTGYGPLSGRKPTRSVGVVLTYAPTGSSAASAQALRIKESNQCEDAWAMHCGLLPPRDGTLLVGGLLSSRLTVRDGVFIAISQESHQADPVEVANALHSLTGNR